MNEKPNFADNPLADHKPGEADHLSKDDLALALRLQAASQQESSAMMNKLYDSEKRRADEERARADEAENDLHSVATLHRLLASPKHARALLRLIQDEMMHEREREGNV